MKADRLVFEQPIVLSVKPIINYACLFKLAYKVF